MLVHGLLISVFIFNKATAIYDEVKNKKIEELKRHKSELFVQINSAIDESVKFLLTANNTEAAMGLEYMRDLRQHIQELNKSDDDTIKDKGIDLGSKSDLENRRRLNGLEFLKKTKSPKSDLFDFEAVLKPKKISSQEWKEMVTNRIKMQKKLDEWILERQKAKERLEKYKMQKKHLVLSGKYEICPRFGYRGKKKKVKDEETVKLRRCKMTDLSVEEFSKCIEATKSARNETDASARKLKSKLSRKNKYPCCRKCCKKSYMGCL